MKCCPFLLALVFNQTAMVVSSQELLGTTMTTSVEDEVTAQLAAAGPVGVAAAAAIVSSKTRRKTHSFETSPSIRKRQQNRLLRKLRQTIDEFSARVGQQAVILIATPGNPTTSYKVFGAKPLEDIIKNLRPTVLEELETALAQQAPAPAQYDPLLFKLPPLIIDGIPTPVEKMTQAQLRTFIPMMLKFSTGRGKPGWGKESTRPVWWPRNLPWANVRMDARSKKEKQKVSWTHALRQIVINCYKYHKREDLLSAFTEEETKLKCMTNVFQTIANPDGTVSFVQVNPNNPIITLPYGTTVQEITTFQTAQEDGTTAEVGIQEATFGQDARIIFTSEDGQEYPVPVSCVSTAHVPMSMYETKANIQQIHTSDNSTISVSIFEPTKGEDTERSTVTHQMMIQGLGSDPPQILQVVSLQGTTELPKVTSIGDFKSEEVIINEQ